MGGEFSSPVLGALQHFTRHPAAHLGVGHFRRAHSFTQYEPDEAQPAGQVPFAGLRMRSRCPASPVPVVPARLGMLGAAVTGWLLLLNGVRCAHAVTGSSSAVRRTRRFIMGVGLLRSGILSNTNLKAARLV
jgi:hypothetical protein